MADAAYVYAAVLVRCVDGDTVHLKLSRTYEFPIDFGFYIKDTVSVTKSGEITFRLLGINTPEMVGASREAGIAAKMELERLLGLGPITAHTFKTDKYGRWLTTLYVSTAEGPLNVNMEMVKGGFAVPYAG